MKVGLHATSLGILGAALLALFLSACQTTGGDRNGASPPDAPDQVASQDTHSLDTGIAGTQTTLPDTSTPIGRWIAETRPGTQADPAPACMITLETERISLHIQRAKGRPRYIALLIPDWDQSFKGPFTFTLRADSGPVHSLFMRVLDLGPAGIVAGAPGLLDELAVASRLHVEMPDGSVTFDTTGSRDAVNWFHDCERRIGTLVTDPTLQRLRAAYSVKGWTGGVVYREDGTFEACAIVTGTPPRTSFLVGTLIGKGQGLYFGYLRDQNWYRRIDSENLNVTIGFDNGTTFSTIASVENQGFQFEMDKDRQIVKDFVQSDIMTVRSDFGTLELSTYNADIAFEWLLQCENYYSD